MDGTRLSIGRGQRPPDRHRSCGTGHYIHWGVVQISVANLVVIAVLVVLFVLALVLPFPGRRDGGSS